MTGPGAGAVTIERLAAGGDGVGHLPDGLTVFVPRTAPGDVVRVVEVRRHRRHAFGRAEAIVERGADRVEPRCVHFVRDGCGGCQWQHLAPDAQRRAKGRIVGDALRRLGKLAVSDPEVVPSPSAFGYRSTLTLAVFGRGPGRAAGLHRVGDSGVFPLERCEIAREPLNALWAALRGSVPVLPGEDGVRLVLRVASGGALHVLVRGGRRAWTAGGVLAVAAAGLEPTVWWQPDGGAVRRMAGPDADAADIAFAQANAGLAAVVRADTVAAVPRDAARVLDLFAGAGAVGLDLAARGADVVTVEIDARAVRWVAARAAERGLRLRALAGRVEDLVPGLLPADAVVVNPPRTGLGAPAAAALRQAPPRRLVYVSCDPATLARDLVRLGAATGRLPLVRGYDMFPQTSHVETLVVLDREEVPG